MAANIFFCYAHEDEDLLNKLKKHLWPLQRQGLIAFWYDRDISAGSEWEQDIKNHLDEADIILLLVSPDFMYSEYCYSIELKRALERNQRGEARVIPIIVRPVYWQGILGHLRALPEDGLPVTDPEWHSIDRALYNIAESLRTVVVQLSKQSISHSEEKLSQASKGEPADVPHLVLTSKLTKPPSSLNPEALSLLQTLTGHSRDVSSVVFSFDGQTLISGSHDTTVKVWNLYRGKELRTLKGHSDYIKRVALSADGQALVSGDEKGMIKVWNLTTGQELRTLTGHTSYIYALALSTDGQTLISGSEDQTIKVWNLTTGQELRTLTGHTGSVLSVAFSPNGKTLASSSSDHTIKIWGEK